MKKGKKVIVLRIPPDTYRQYLVYDDASDDAFDTLEIPVGDLMRLIEGDEDACEYFAGSWFTREVLERLDSCAQIEILDDLMDLLGVKVQPEILGMSASNFKRYLCDLLGLPYSANETAILRAVIDKMEGKA